MVVATHGEVADFCKKYNMKVLETYVGDLSDYNGNSPILVTDESMTRERYDLLKCELFARGVDLVSTQWLDDDVVLRLIRGDIERRRKRAGRQMFGFYRKNGVISENPAMIEVARRVIELRDSGLTYRDIREAEGIRHPDGKKIAISTLGVIVKNREKYKK